MVRTPLELLMILLYYVIILSHDSNYEKVF